MINVGQNAPTAVEKFAAKCFEKRLNNSFSTELLYRYH